MTTKRELKRELERLGTIGGRSPEDLPLLTLAEGLSAEEGEIEDTPVEGVVLYKGRPCRMIDMSKVDPDNMDDGGGP